jgi:hypothetical protein
MPRVVNTVGTAEINVVVVDSNLYKMVDFLSIVSTVDSQPV